MGLNTIFFGLVKLDASFIVNEYRNSLHKQFLYMNRSINQLKKERMNEIHKQIIITTSSLTNSSTSICKNPSSMSHQPAKSSWNTKIQSRKSSPKRVISAAILANRIQRSCRTSCERASKSKSHNVPSSATTRPAGTTPTSRTTTVRPLRPRARNSWT